MKNNKPEAYKYEKKSNNSTPKILKAIKIIDRKNPKTIIKGAVYIITISKHEILPVLKNVFNSFPPYIFKQLKQPLVHLLRCFQLAQKLCGCSS